MAMPSVAFCAGSWATPVYDSVSSSSGIKTVTFAWTADAADHTTPNYTVPAAALAFMEGYWIYWVETNPGATAPTDNYDITMLSSGGADMFRSKLLNRDEANTEVVKGLNIPCDGTALTIVVSNNLVNSATGTIKLYLTR